MNIFSRETGQALGTAISHVGGQVGADIDRHNTAAWIGHGAATYSSLYGDLTQQWNELAAKSDPNDTSIAQGFKEKVLGPSIENFQKGFEGAPDDAQKWALTRADEMRQHFFTKMTADMGTRAGAAVHQNLVNKERIDSITAQNDPSSLSHIVDTINADVGAMIASTPNLTAAQAAHVQGEIVPKMTQRIAQSAFDGMAQRDPAAALSALDHGDFNKYADAVTQAQWRKYAEAQQKVQAADQRRERLEAAQQLKEDSAARSEEYRTKMYDVNTGRILRVQPRLNQQIVQDMNNGLLTRADGTSLIRWNQQQYEAQVREDKISAEGPPARNDEKVLADLRQRVGDPDKPTTRQEVGDAMAAGKLTTKDAHDLAWRVGQDEASWQAIQRPFKQQFANVKSLAMNSVTSMVKYLPPDEQLARLNQVEADAQRIVREAYASRDRQLMRDVLDPKSSKWAFREAMTQITGNPRGSIAEKAEAMRRGPAAGDVQNGFRFNGGNPADQKNWTKVEPSLADQIPQ